MLRIVVTNGTCASVKVWSNVMNAAALPMFSAEARLARYVNEIKRFPMLEQQQEYMLAKLWRYLRSQQ
jgi:hypothetical protein